MSPRAARAPGPPLPSDLLSPSEGAGAHSGAPITPGEPRSGPSQSPTAPSWPHGMANTGPARGLRALTASGDLPGGQLMGLGSALGVYVFPVPPEEEQPPRSPVGWQLWVRLEASPGGAGPRGQLMGGPSGGSRAWLAALGSSWGLWGLQMCSKVQPVALGVVLGIRVVGEGAARQLSGANRWTQAPGVGASGVRPMGAGSCWQLQGPLVVGCRIPLGAFRVWLMAVGSCWGLPGSG